MKSQDKNSKTCSFESLSNNDDDPDQLQLKILQLKLKIAMRRHKHDPIHKPAQQIFDPSGIPKPQSIKNSIEVNESDHETVLKHSTKVKKEIDNLIKSEVFETTNSTKIDSDSSVPNVSQYNDNEHILRSNNYWLIS